MSKNADSLDADLSITALRKKITAEPTNWEAQHEL